MFKRIHTFGVPVFFILLSSVSQGASHLGALDPFLPEGFQIDKSGEPGFVPQHWDQKINRPQKGSGDAFYYHATSSKISSVKIKFNNSSGKDAFALSPEKNQVIGAGVNAHNNIDGVTGCTPNGVCVTVNASVCNHILAASGLKSWALLQKEMQSCSGINAAAAWAGNKARFNPDSERERLAEMDRFLTQVAESSPSLHNPYPDGVGDFYMFVNTTDADDKKIKRVKTAFTDGLSLIAALCFHVPMDNAATAGSVSGGADSAADAPAAEPKLAPEAPKAQPVHHKAAAPAINR